MTELEIFLLIALKQIASIDGNTEQECGCAKCQIAWQSIKVAEDHQARILNAAKAEKQVS